MTLEHQAEKGFTLVELIVVVGIFCSVLLLWPLTIWTGRSIDWALEQWKHHPVHISYWLDFLIVLIGNGVTLIFDVIIEVLRRAV